MEFSVIGGDVRQKYLTRLLRQDGHAVLTAALDLPGVSVTEAAQAANVILPLPTAADDGTLNTPLSGEKIRLEELFAAIKPGTSVFVGRADKNLFRLAEKAGVTAEDYFTREDFTVKNAALTAEGAIQLLMTEKPSALSGMRCLVIGYGRIGRFLAEKLKALGACVTVSARKSGDMAWIECFGYTPADTRRLEGGLGDFDAVINTVPAPVLGRGRLAELKKDCLCLDLASAPGGVDIKAAEELGVRAVPALSLPGKTAPESAGRIIRDTIYNMVSERSNH